MKRLAESKKYKLAALELHARSDFDSLQNVVVCSKSVVVAIAIAMMVVVVVVGGADAGADAGAGAGGGGAGPGAGAGASVGVLVVLVVGIEFPRFQHFGTESAVFMLVLHDSGDEGHQHEFRKGSSKGYLDRTTLQESSGIAQHHRWHSVNFSILLGDWQWKPWVCKSDDWRFVDHPRWSKLVNCMGGMPVIRLCRGTTWAKARESRAMCTHIFKYTPSIWFVYFPELSPEGQVWTKGLFAEGMDSFCMISNNGDVSWRLMWLAVAFPWLFLGQDRQMSRVYCL